MGTKKRCVGCEERFPNNETKRYPKLGYVCLACDEVIDLVYETELERVQDACKAIEAFLQEFPP